MSGRGDVGETPVKSILKKVKMKNSPGDACQTPPRCGVGCSKLPERGARLAGQGTNTSLP